MCQKIIAKIFGDGKSSESLDKSCEETLHQKTLKTSIPEQILTQIQAMPYKIKRIRKNIFNSFSGIEDNPSQHFQIKLDNRITTPTLDFTSYTTKKQYDIKEVVQKSKLEMGQKDKYHSNSGHVMLSVDKKSISKSGKRKNENFQQSYIAKKFEKQNQRSKSKSPVVKRKKESPPKNFPENIPQKPNPLTPAFEPAFNDKPLLFEKIDNIQGEKMIYMETILTECREKIIPTFEESHQDTTTINIEHAVAATAVLVDKNLVLQKDNSKHALEDAVNLNQNAESEVLYKNTTENYMSPDDLICIDKTRSKSHVKGKISLEAMLKQVREQNRKKWYFQEFKSEDSKVTKSKKEKKPPCPPPPPSCPPDPPKPCPAPCPKPTPTPTVCPPPSECPPPPKKCLYQLNNLNYLFIPFNDMILAANKEEFLSPVLESEDTVPGKKYIKRNKNIVKSIINDIIKKSLRVVNLNVYLLRSFEPWAPIPSWPMPKEMPRRQCPKEAKLCKKPLPPKICEPCKLKPCFGYPKNLWDKS